jgi:hypothetical protein
MEVCVLASGRDNSRIAGMLTRRAQTLPEDTAAAQTAPPHAAAAIMPNLIDTPDTRYGVSSSVLDKAFWDDPPPPPACRLPESEFDEFCSVSDIYTANGFPLSGTSTIYLVEECIKALPDSLPAEMRRSIVLKFLNASGFDFDTLLNDGIDRVTTLNSYSAMFSARTEEAVIGKSAEINELLSKADMLKEQISERKNLHKRQFLELESEAQRLKDILDFITK